MQTITRTQELAGDSYFIFKHSNRCPVSARAHSVVASAEGSVTIPIYKVIVHDTREVSQDIADTFGVQHESPQLILVRNGRAVWHASHFGITEKAITDAVA